MPDAPDPDPAFSRADAPDRLRGRGIPPRPAEWGGPLDRLVDRVRDLRGDPRVGVVALVVVALVAGFIWYRLGASDSGASGASPTASRAPGPAPATSRPSGDGTAKTDGRIVVHVAGAVAAPGVYDLDAVARVIDAVEAAGGGVADADLNRLNLAAMLTDGQRVHVPRIGEVVAPVPGTPGGSEAAVSADPSGRVNINTATQAELEELPGIGPTLAQAIITERERRGGFRSLNELRDVRGIGEKRFADLEGKVTI